MHREYFVVLTTAFHQRRDTHAKNLGGEGLLQQPEDPLMLPESATNTTKNCIHIHLNSQHKFYT